MSRVDEALRRASSDTTILRAVAVEPVGVVVDGSAFDRYAAEHQSMHRDSPHPALVAPTPGVEPAAGRREPFPVFHRSLEGRVVTSRETNPVSVEQYRRLAVALIAAQAERGLKTLMVSSALPHDGKTLTVTNLAVTLSESYERNVLLIDADLRRPCIHELFGLPNVRGLADGLRSIGAPVEPIQISSRLSVLPGGPSDETAMAGLSSDRMRALLAEASSRFDWVLVDTPPVGLLSDANLVARVTDGVLFVIAAGSTPYELVQRGIEELGADRIVGTVLNRVDERVMNVHSYYGRYYSAQ